MADPPHLRVSECLANAVSRLHTFPMLTGYYHAMLQLQAIHYHLPPAPPQYSIDEWDAIVEEDIVRRIEASEVVIAQYTRTPPYFLAPDYDFYAFTADSQSRAQSRYSIPFEVNFDNVNRPCDARSASTPPTEGPPVSPPASPPAAPRARSRSVVTSKPFGPEEEKSEQVPATVKLPLHLPRAMRPRRPSFLRFEAEEDTTPGDIGDLQSPQGMTRAHETDAPHSPVKEPGKQASNTSHAVGSPFSNTPTSPTKESGSLFSNTTTSPTKESGSPFSNTPISEVKEQRTQASNRPTSPAKEPGSQASTGYQTKTPPSAKPIDIHNHGSAKAPPSDYDIESLKGVVSSRALPQVDPRFLLRPTPPSPSGMSIDDIRSAGYFALVEAIPCFWETLLETLDRTERAALLATCPAVFSLVMGHMVSVLPTPDYKFCPVREIVHLGTSSNLRVRRAYRSTYEHDVPLCVVQIIGYRFRSQDDLVSALGTILARNNTRNASCLEVIGCPFFREELLSCLPALLPNLKRLTINDCAHFDLPWALEAKSNHFEKLPYEVLVDFAEPRPPTEILWFQPDSKIWPDYKECQLIRAYFHYAVIAAQAQDNNILRTQRMMQLHVHEWIDRVRDYIHFEHNSLVLLPRKSPDRISFESFSELLKNNELQKLSSLAMEIEPKLRDLETKALKTHPATLSTPCYGCSGDPDDDDGNAYHLGIFFTESARAEAKRTKNHNLTSTHCSLARAKDAAERFLEASQDSYPAYTAEQIVQRAQQTPHNIAPVPTPDEKRELATSVQDLLKQQTKVKAEIQIASWDKEFYTRRAALSQRPSRDEAKACAQAYRRELKARVSDATLAAGPEHDDGKVKVPPHLRRKPAAPPVLDPKHAGKNSAPPRPARAAVATPNLGQLRSRTSEARSSASTTSMTGGKTKESSPAKAPDADNPVPKVTSSTSTNNQASTLGATSSVNMADVCAFHLDNHGLKTDKVTCYGRLIPSAAANCTSPKTLHVCKDFFDDALVCPYGNFGDGDRNFVPFQHIDTVTGLSVVHIAPTCWHALKNSCSKPDCPHGHDEMALRRAAREFTQGYNKELKAIKAGKHRGH